VYIFHAIPHTGLSPVYYPGIHHYRRGKGLSNMVTIEATKFAGFHMSHMHQYIINLTHRGQTIDPSSTQTGAITIRASNIKWLTLIPSHPVFSTFP
jgi:hypothetical protein